MAYEPGVLEHEVEVRLLNVSGSGCLVESSRPLPIGSAAVLSVDSEFGVLLDEVQVVRCEAMQGAGSRYTVGLRFLWVSMPEAQTLRWWAAAWGAGIAHARLGVGPSVA